MKKNILILSIVIGILVLFYYTAYIPFSQKSKLLYLQSDYIKTIKVYHDIEVVLASNTDNYASVDYRLLIDQLSSLKSLAKSNKDYVYTTNLQDTDLGSQLVIYYTNVESLSNNLMPKTEYRYFAEKIQAIANVLIVDISNSDNYDFIAGWINESSSKINALKGEFDASTVLNESPELKNFLDQYFNDSINYYTALNPVVATIPSYLEKNNRDETRKVIDQIKSLSSQYLANETNLRDLANQYIQTQQSDLIHTSLLIKSLNTQINMGFRPLSSM